MAREGTNNQCKLRNAIVTFSHIFFIPACYLLLPSCCKSNGNCRPKSSQKRKQKGVKSLVKEKQVMVVTQKIVSHKWEDRWETNHWSIIIMLIKVTVFLTKNGGNQCKHTTNSRSHVYNKTCRLAFILCCMMVNTMTHLDKFRIWKRHLHQLLLSGKTHFLGLIL